MSFWIVGKHMGVELPIRLAVCASQTAAEEYVGLLPGADDGRYYIDGPCVGPVVLESVPLLTGDEARNILRRKILVDQRYTFFCEMQQEYEPVEERMRNYTGQQVTVIAREWGPWEDKWTRDDSIIYKVRADNGFEFLANEEELNGWDRDLGQYFWPDGTWGPDRKRDFIGNERVGS
jgi:hypothetical protein